METGRRTVYTYTKNCAPLSHKTWKVGRYTGGGGVGWGPGAPGEPQGGFPKTDKIRHLTY